MTDQITFDVEGMTCASCATRIERVLAKQDGVDEVVVNLAAREARVQIIDGTEVAGLEAAISRIGYDISERSEDAAGPALDEIYADEQQAAWRRFVVAAVFTVPVLILAMGGFESTASRWAQFILSTPVVLGAGFAFHRAAARRLQSFGASMDTLISLGSLAAWAYSIWALVSDDPVFFETGAAIVSFILLGRFFEARANGSASQAITRLLQLGAKEATVEFDGHVATIDVDRLRVGDIMLVAPGEKIPSDGRIVEGSTAIDESMLTGESVPVERGPGQDVFGSTINQHGALKVEVTAVGDDTALSRIVDLVQSAQASKAPIQRLADRISGIFVPVVMVLALATLIGWLIADGDASQAVRNAVAVLIIACPCALGLATPTAVLVGSGRAAEMGVVFRSADVFERFAEIDVVAFDKTGTLTTGMMQLVAVESAEPGFLELVAGVEERTGHPIGAAVAAGAIERGVDPADAGDVLVAQGQGASGVVDDTRIHVGKPKYLADEGIHVDSSHLSTLEEWETNGWTTFAAGWNGVSTGVLAVADEPRPTAAAAVADLDARGVRVAMITGDNETTARVIGRQVGVSDIRAGTMPEEKAAAVERWQAEGLSVAFVGDGVNDAPALARADLGLSVGTGSDVAIETADVTLMNGDPALTVKALAIARRTLRAIKQNLGWAFAYNTIAIPVAMAGLLTPMIASAAMAFSSVSVVANSLRVRRFGRS